MFYTLTKHGFSTNQSARWVLSLLLMENKRKGGGKGKERKGGTALKIPRKNLRSALNIFIFKSITGFYCKKIPRSRYTVKKKKEEK